MSKLVWDQAGQRTYETGVEQGALYLLESGAYSGGEAWNGLISVTESPSGAEPTALYANDSKYLELMSNEEFGGTIEAYTYPDGFAQCNGALELATGVLINQQTRHTFGLVYKTLLGNDEKGNDYGYKLHLVYGAKVSPSEKANTTVNDSPEALTLSWEFSTTPVSVSGFKPTSHLEISSVTADATKLAALEAILYGSDSDDARLPLPDEVATLMGDSAEG